MVNSKRREGERRKPKATGVARLMNAAGYSLKGLQYTFRSEEAFRLEIYLLPIVLIAGYLFAKGDGVKLALLWGSYGLVLLMELANSAIEAVVDRIGEEIHPLSGAAKDIGSALVFVALLMMGIIWSLLIFY